MAGGRQISNPNLAYGYTGADQKLFKMVIEGVASTDLAAGNAVQMGTTGNFTPSVTNGTASLVVGITDEAISSGKTGKVVVAGIKQSVSAAGAVAAGDVLKRSATTAGYVSATATPAVGEALGVALAASASNVVDVWVWKSN